MINCRAPYSPECAATSALQGVLAGKFSTKEVILRSLQSPYLVLLIGLCSTMTQPAAGDGPDREVYWGEQHVHTSWSFDAYAFGNTLTGPEEFYQYAQGQPVPHPGGYDVKITRPLDWGAVTEHSDYMGLVQEANDPDSVLRQSSGFLSGMLRIGINKDPMLAFKALSAAIATGHDIEAFTNPDVMAPVWERVVRAADKYYQPGKFTTFPAFEWSATPDANNLHRNVFFVDSAKVPRAPFTSIDSTNPKDLWAWMDAQRAIGNDVLAVSHNGNLSSGRMYPRQTDQTGEPIDAQWASARMRNEPLSELKQTKGQSETIPALSPNDEFANYEVFVWQLLGSKAAPQNYGSYARQAYRDGLAIRQGKGFNPYQFGVVGGSDFHTTAPAYRQKNYFGAHGTADDTIEERVNGNTVLDLNSLWASPAGLSAVWAEENTREALFAGLRRKETYGTTGVRIKLRFFAGWDYEEDLFDQSDWKDQAYAGGVPMGGQLPPRVTDSPRLAIWAARDPDSANLDRIQVVKGWSINGQSFEKIYDVAWAGKRSPDPVTGKLPAQRSSVNLSKGTYKNNIGSSELKTVWVDPDFNPKADAFYYVRVLEIPTPRWSTIQAAQLGKLPPSGPGYSPAIQERAWSSPIWYSADAQTGSADDSGVTVTQLHDEGISSFTDDELRKLIVGKTIEVSNRVTGQRITILYGTGGRRLVTEIDGEPADATHMVETMHGGPIGYEIQGGQLITNLAGERLEVRVFKQGDNLLAARSDEFGYVNYTVEVVDE